LNPALEKGAASPGGSWPRANPVWGRGGVGNVTEDA